MRLLLVGGSGLLGTALQSEAAGRGFEVVAPSSRDLDISDPKSVSKVAIGEWGAFDWVINCAAYTNVDLAETERERAWTLNAAGPSYLVNASLGSASRLLHLSTDYVFGRQPQEWFDEDSPLAPLQYYGETKAAGEEAVIEAAADAIVARVSWLFGSTRRCFPFSIVEGIEAKRDLRVVDDQFGVPTFATEAARMLLDLADNRAPGGIYHIAGQERVSRLAYAEAVATSYAQATASEAPKLAGTSSASFPTPALRPAQSALRVGKALAFTQPHAPLAQAMDRFMADYLSVR